MEDLLDFGNRHYGDLAQTERQPFFFFFPDSSRIFFSFVSVLFMVDFSFSEIPMWSSLKQQKTQLGLVPAGEDSRGSSGSDIRWWSLGTFVTFQISVSLICIKSTCFIGVLGREIEVMLLEPCLL